MKWPIDELKTTSSYKIYMPSWPLFPSYDHSHVLLFRFLLVFFSVIKIALFCLTLAHADDHSKVYMHVIPNFITSMFNMTS